MAFRKRLQQKILNYYILATNPQGCLQQGTAGLILKGKMNRNISRI